MAYYSNECCMDDENHEKCTDLLCSCSRHDDDHICPKYLEPSLPDEQGNCSLCGKHPA